MHNTFRIFIALTTTTYYLVYAGRTDLDGEDSQFQLLESEQMALELSSELLPTTTVALELTRKISIDLEKIRESYGGKIGNVTHERSWVPGELLSTRMTNEHLRRVNESIYGPLKKVEIIDLSPIYIVTAMTFKEPYHPVTLGRLLQAEFGFASSPNTVFYNGDDVDVAYANKEEKNSLKYTFKKENSDCTENCPERHIWEFIATGPVSDRNITLEKDYSLSVQSKLLYPSMIHEYYIRSTIENKLK